MLRKNSFKIFIVLTLFIFSNIAIYASPTTFSYSQKDLDIIFVLDYSNSMNANDKNKVALEMLETFIDSAFSAKTRIGFVAYNHKILKSREPSSIATKDERSHLKNQLMSIPRSGSTDIGLALTHAYDLLEKDPARQSIIVLLSDGESDLTYARTGRSIEDCNRDMDTISKKCADTQIPIYSIAFGNKFDGSPASLKALSDTTSAMSYVSAEPSGLIEIFNEILSTCSMSSIIPIASSLSSGQLQAIDIPLGASKASEANILVVSSSPIQEANIFYSGNDLTFNKSNYYFTSKIPHPNADNIKLELKTSPNQNVKIYLLLYQDADFIVELPDVIDKNKPFTISSYFYNNEQKVPITDQAFYDGLTPTLTIYDAKGTSKIAPAPSFKEGKWLSEVTLNSSGDYTMDYSSKGLSYALALNTLPFSCSNTAPSGAFEDSLVYSPIHEPITFDLSTYFSDPNQDVLTYTLENISGTGTTFDLKGDQLILNPKNSGDFAFSIKATDTEGAHFTASPTLVKVLPIWRYYLKITLSIILGLLIITFGIVYYVIQKKLKAPKPLFSGKLNAYFTKLPDIYEDIEPLTFSLFQIDAKQICLSELLEGAGVDLFKTENIFFKPSLDRNLVFYHHSKHSIMIGSSIACKNINYSLEYNNRIYITSEDGEYELELHYVSSKA